MPARSTGVVARPHGRTLDRSSAFRSDVHTFDATNTPNRRDDPKWEIAYGVRCVASIVADGTRLWSGSRAVVRERARHHAHSGAAIHHEMEPDCALATHP